MDKQRFQNGMVAFLLVLLCLILFSVSARVFNAVFKFEKFPENIIGIMFGLGVMLAAVAFILGHFSRQKKKVEEQKRQEEQSEAVISQGQTEEKTVQDGPKYDHCDSCLHVGEMPPVFCLECTQQDSEKPPSNYEEG